MLSSVPHPRARRVPIGRDCSGHRMSQSQLIQLYQKHKFNKIYIDISFLAEINKHTYKTDLVKEFINLDKYIFFLIRRN